ncbi:hypothetical protein KPB2_5347 [Klebsiella pneumoniae Kb677]|nr:hypothetical protein KPB2_5347 [Klebsiella pneumoniae Kb677]
MKVTLLLTVVRFTGIQKQIRPSCVSPSEPPYVLPSTTATVGTTDTFGQLDLVRLGRSLISSVSDYAFSLKKKPLHILPPRPR